jgi:hypothetical protein
MDEQLTKRLKEATWALKIFFPTAVVLEFICVLMITHRFAALPGFAKLPKIQVFLRVLWTVKYGVLAGVLGGPVLFGVMIYFASGWVGKKQSETQ